SAQAAGPCGAAPRPRVDLPGGRRRLGKIARSTRALRGAGPSRRLKASQGQCRRPLPARPCTTCRSSGPGRPRISPPAGCRALAPPTMTQMNSDHPYTTRPLSYSDLPQVIAIERRAFPTPWSLAMFVLELSKPSGFWLAAEREGRLVGYLVCSRYDTVWHLMNVAVEPELRRQGLASALLEALFVKVGEDDP